MVLIENLLPYHRYGMMARSTQTNCLRWIYMWLLFNSNTLCVHSVQTHTEKAVRHVFDQFSKWITGLGANNEENHEKAARQFQFTLLDSDFSTKVQNDSVFDTSGRRNIRSRPMSTYYRQALPSQLTTRQKMTRYGREYNNNDHPNDVFKFPRAQQGDVCDLPQVIGTGPYRIPRWNFNPNTKRCELFYYSGCCGNGNNFPTYESCQVLCEVDPCTQDRDPGVGSLQIPRNYFNQQTKFCEKFTYFGSGGNRNNFATLEECRARCPENPNPCAYGDPMRAGNGGFMQCGFSLVVTNTCPINYYCHVGSSVTTTICCPKGPGDRCDQTIRMGLGSENLPRWYFDTNRQDCREFQYKGLQGNENNFLSKADCDNACFINPCAQGDPYRSGGTVVQCSAHNQGVCPGSYYCHIGAEPRTTICCPVRGIAAAAPTSPCFDPLNLGQGFSNLRRYYFNSITRTCNEFMYRGEKGNRNNFVDEIQCKFRCPVFRNPCAGGEPVLSVKGGTKSCAMHRSCQRHTYCHYGMNDFDTVCCPSLGNPCTLPLSKGVGIGVLDRFFYNSSVKECQPFTYRGLKGNDNNFRTIQECYETCLVYPSPCAEAAAGSSPGFRPVSCAAQRICPIGYWCHIGARPDTTVCCIGRDNRCVLPMVQGTGNSNLPRFYYNPNSRQCVSFTYRGMYGNANNFLTQAECELTCPVWVNPCPQGQPILGPDQRPQTCRPDSPCAPSYWCHLGASADTTVCCPGASDPCRVQYSVGQGETNLPRWHYEQSSKSCNSFTYRGLRGNQNNFLSREDCEATCPVWVNPCANGQPILGADARPEQCDPRGASCPINYWCHLGYAPGTTVCCPGRSDPCRQPLTEGTGQYSLPRFFFDATTRTCRQFTYRGLRGNQNNFIAETDCESTCPIFINPCPSPLIGGSQVQYCSGSNPSCGGNQWCHVGADRDTTLCCPNAGDPCSQPLARGRGASSLPRFYYDGSSRTCRPFTYSGLSGNQNNFLSLSDCEGRCPVFVNPCLGSDPLLVGGRPQQCSEGLPCPSSFWCHVGSNTDTTVCCPNARNPCDQPMSQGQGNSALSRWVFDPNGRQCTSFNYRGLKGNQNNFLSRQDCEATCPVFKNPCASGAPYEGPGRMALQCSRGGAACPPSFWCHIGGAIDSTVCCPGAGDPCIQPMIQGDGAFSLSRWFYNPLTRECNQFSYRGTLGNQNNFLTQSECEANCPVFVNPCREGDPLILGGGRPERCSSLNPQTCGIGYWCHLGADQDTTVCCPGNEDSCTMQMQQGTGPSSLPRFFFNTATRQCQPFTYRGLFGNQNNFPSQGACEGRCPVFVNPCAFGPPAEGAGGQPGYCSEINPSCPPTFYCHFGVDRDSTVCCPARGDPCIQTMSRGTGRSSLTRWYYNSMTRQCISFTYSGLKGNQNNFLSREDCEATCPVFLNPCPVGDPQLGPSGRPLPCRFEPEGVPGTCAPGYWCHLGGDIETTVCCRGSLSQSCQGLAPDEGVSVPGRPSVGLQRWFYDRNQRRCLQFQYRGAKGNPNNFITQPDCENTCPVWSNPCSLPVDSPTYCSGGGFDTCPRNQWCHIGANRESTVCCPGASVSPCDLPLAAGQGNDALPRFYFNSLSRQCVAYTYRGTRGNQNNFLSQEQCEQVCPVFVNPCETGQPYVGSGNRPQTCNALTTTSSCPSNYWCHVGADIDTTVCCPETSKTPCNLPISTGLGNANLPRWYYSAGGRRCEQFTYSGLKGNQNNFISQEACRLSCREFENPCIGQPAEAPNGQPIFCSVTNKENCPVNFWCHLGATPETTLCCPGATNPCSVPLAPGTGSSNLPRWYYNADSRQCVSFTYNGIRGNQNNFISQSECSNVCPVWQNPCPGASAGNMGAQNRPQTCSGFFGGNSCAPNFWCHIGATPQDTVCCPNAVDDPCGLPRAAGNGEESLQRWYFDSNEKKCKEMNYTGREGNQNNFLSRAECLDKCPEFDNPCIGEPEMDPRGQPKVCSKMVPMTCGFGYFCHAGDPEGGQPDICCPGFAQEPCEVKVTEGDGEKSLQRWYYNPMRRNCDVFFYRGKHGNENNFNDKETCETSCIPDINPCYFGDEPFKESGKNLLCRPDFETCPANYYCHVGEDEFSTVCCPKRGNTCEQQLLLGTGAAEIERWYYSPEDDQCKTFTYTGRGGNQNNHITKSRCEDACPGFRGFCPHGKPLLISSDPQECGVETACPNNYVCHINTQISRSICCFDPAYFCVLPRDPGPCNEFNPRYGYNRMTGTCTPFQFGGCGGNLNNFGSLEKCTEICCDKGY